jgi:ABC-type transport system involved in multi-copper enzyme maturation permease subunit
MRSMKADSSFGQSMMAIRRWSIRRWVVAGIVSALTALFIGIPTGIVRTGFYTRMTPVLWWNYPIWVASSMLTGLVVATYLRSATLSTGSEAKFVSGGSLLSFLAVGCPVCNKLVVLAVGATGAMNLWAPVQPLLGVVSLTLLLWAFARRLRGEVACAVPNAAQT